MMGGNEKFKIHAYGKSELAMQYFPNDSPERALKKFRFWLSQNKRLKGCISRGNNFYNPKQVRMIIEELGEPD